MSVLDTHHSSIHFPLPECKCFLKAIKRVLLDASAWILLFVYNGIEYKFKIFSSSHKFIYMSLSNCCPLFVIMDWGIPNKQTMIFHMNQTTSLSLMEADGPMVSV